MSASAQFPHSGGEPAIHRGPTWNHAVPKPSVNNPRPVRLAQLPQVGPGIAPPPTPGDGPPLELLAPGELPPPGAPRVRDDLQMPFQQRLPDELIVRPPTEATRQEFERFIPKIVDPQNTLELVVGRPRILTFAEEATKPEMRLYIPDNQVARWDIISDTEVAIVGLQPGSTVLTIWFNDPTTDTGKRVLSYLVRVFEDPEFRATVDDLEQQINEVFPDSYVKLSIVRDRLVVKGQAKDAVEAGQILMLLAQTRRGRQRGGEVEPATQVSEYYLDQDRLLLEEEAAERRSLVDPTAIAAAGIVNLLQIPGEQQVSLRVTVAEVNRSALRSIGADMKVGGGDVSFLSLLSPNTIPALMAGVPNASKADVIVPNFTPRQGGNLVVNTPDFRLALNALRTLGYARTLAEPNLTTLNGRAATFRAGDTFPVPLAQAAFGGVGQGVQFEFVGVAIQFTPFIVDRDRIRLQVTGNVSTRDDASGANVGGTQVPGQNTRTFFTTVELRNGQTMALAGLLQNTLGSEATRVPWLGDLPVIGTLFSNKSTTASEQELVVLVTPELVHPLDACHTPPVPGADLREPTDVEFFLGNRMESRRAQDFRSPVRTDYYRIRQIEHCCHDPFIIGPSGHSYGCCHVPVKQPLPLPLPAQRSPAEGELLPPVRKAIRQPPSSE